MKKYKFAPIFACLVLSTTLQQCYCMEKKETKGLYIRAYELYLLEEAGSDVNLELQNLKKETQCALCQNDDMDLQVEVGQLKTIIMLGEIAESKGLGHEKLTTVGFGKFAKRLLNKTT